MPASVRDAVLREAARIWIAFMPYKVRVHRIGTDGRLLGKEIAGQGTLGLEILEQVPDVDGSTERIFQTCASPLATQPSRLPNKRRQLA